MDKKIRFAIRDDDTCFFTEPEELERVYKDIKTKIPVSLSTVPFSVPVHRDRTILSDKHPKDVPVPIENNKELVEYLIEEIRKEHFEICYMDIHMNIKR